MGSHLLSLLSALALALPAQAGALDSWTRLPAQAFSQPNLNGVAFGNGTFVAVGPTFTRTNAFVSTNGLDWRPVVIGTGSSLPAAITFGKNRFVVATGGGLYSSPDGFQWNSTPASAPGATRADFPQGVAFDHGLFLACDNGHKSTWASAAADQWTQTMADNLESPLVRLEGLAGGNGIFLSLYQDWAFTSPPKLFMTVDGTSWKEVAGAPALISLAFLNGQFVAATGGGAGKYFRSTNGMDWMAEGEAIDFGISAPITYGNGIYVAASSVTFFQTFTSPNLMDWTPSSLFSGLPTGMAFGNGLFVKVGNTGIATSSDGLNWNDLTDNFELQSTAFGNGQFVTVGSGHSGYALTHFAGYAVDSSTLAIHRFSILARSFHHSSVLFGGGAFVAFTDVGDIFSSTDGFNWTNSSSVVGSSWSCGVYASNQFYLYGNAGRIVTSPNGTDWKGPSDARTPALTKVVFGDGTFLGIATNSLTRSMDGTNWVAVPLSAAPFLPSDIIFGNGHFLGLGAFTPNGGRSGVFISRDGLNWSQSLNSSLSGVYALSFGVYGNGRFVAFGDREYETTDGIRWTIHDSYLPLSSAAFGNGRFFEIGPGQFMAVSDATSLAFQVFAQDAPFPAEAATASPSAFTLTRTFDLGYDIDLPVRVSFSGSATNGVDYETLSSTLIIPAGQLSAHFEVIPKQRPDLQDKTVEISILAGEAYSIGAPQIARAQISNHADSMIFGRAGTKLNSNGLFEFDFRNPTSSDAQIESSIDLVHWSASSLKAPANSLTNIFQRPLTNRQEFFRSRQ